MAKYVVLSFDDDSDADNFLEYALSGCVASLHVDSAPDDPQTHDAQVVGVFKQPTIFCRCPGGAGRIHAWTLGQKWGWWVCKNCKRPSEATAGPLQQMRCVVSQAKNLLGEFIMIDPVADEPASVWDKGWGVLGRD